MSVFVVVARTVRAFIERVVTLQAGAVDIGSADVEAAFVGSAEPFGAGRREAMLA